MQKNIDSFLNFSIFHTTESSDENDKRNDKKNQRSLSHSIIRRKFDQKSFYVRNDYYNFNDRTYNVNNMNAKSIFSKELLHKKNESFDYDENSSFTFFENFKVRKTEERINKIRGLINKTIERKKNNHEAIIRRDYFMPKKLNFEDSFRIKPLDMAGKKKISVFMIKMLTIMKNSRRKNMRRLFTIYRPLKEECFVIIRTKYKEKTVKLFTLKIEKFLLLRKILFFSRFQSYIEFKTKIYRHLSQKMINIIKWIVNLRKKEIFTEYLEKMKTTNKRRKNKHKRNNSAFIIWVDKLSFIYFKKQAEVIKYSWNQIKTWNLPLNSNDYSFTFQNESHSSKVSIEDQSNYLESNELRAKLKLIPYKSVKIEDQIDENDYFSFSQRPNLEKKFANNENFYFVGEKLLHNRNKKNELTLDDDQYLNFEILHMFSSFKKKYNYKNLFQQ